MPCSPLSIAFETLCQLAGCKYFWPTNRTIPSRCQPNGRGCDGQGCDGHVNGRGLRERANGLGFDGLFDGHASARGYHLI